MNIVTYSIQFQRKKTGRNNNFKNILDLKQYMEMKIIFHFKQYNIIVWSQL